MKEASLVLVYLKITYLPSVITQIEVEQSVTRLPPHRSLRAELPHKALQNCSLAHGTDFKPSESMTDSWFGDSKVFYQFIKPSPIVALAL